MKSSYQCHQCLLSIAQKGGDSAAANIAPSVGNTDFSYVRSLTTLWCSSIDADLQSKGLK